ncbi:MAG: CDP-glycerol glycerophosphotransferase family protein [Lachnospiraceae bacterium]|nr:CDP-glycerol glycerophosphotransferase family protein [Lachnospiraceae bacterium]
MDQNIAEIISQTLPKVSFISLYCDKSYVEMHEKAQTWMNLETVQLEEGDSLEDLMDYILNTDSKYLSFLEDRHWFDADKILKMVLFMEKWRDCGIVVSPRGVMEEDGSFLARGHYLFEDALCGESFIGKKFLKYCIQKQINLYGDLSCLLVSTEYAKSVLRGFRMESPDPGIKRTAFLYRLLSHTELRFLEDVYVGIYVEPYSDDSDMRRLFQDYLRGPLQIYLGLSEEDINSLGTSPQEGQGPVKLATRKITFFCESKGQLYNVEPVIDEARARGYEIHMTEDLGEKADIGIYCQHRPKPENSEFSVILLHDLGQGQEHWPAFWEIEHWDIYDLGILPGPFWGEMWSRTSFDYYTIPRHGAFALGFPKGDTIGDEKIGNRAGELREELGLKYDYSILYAPSYENDGKEHDFVSALQSLPVNLLIKQAHWPGKYQSVLEDIARMRDMHEGKYNNVYYIEPEESIMTALAMCDLIVSDESSVMAEGLMFGKPSIAVMDWKIPDTTPARYSCVPIDYVYRCNKADLRENAEKFLKGEISLARMEEWRDLLFGNMGNCSRDILDAIEYYTGQGEEKEFMKFKLRPKYAYQVLWDKD